MKNPEINGYLSAWTGHGNVGDELVHDIFFTTLRDALRQRFGVPVSLSWDTRRPTPYAGPMGYKEFDFGVLGGGSTIAPMYAEKLKPIFNNNLPIFAHGSGFQFTGLAEDQFADIFSIVKSVGGGGFRGRKTIEFLNEKEVVPRVGLLADSGLIAPWTYNWDYGLRRSIFPLDIDKYVIINILDKDSHFEYIVDLSEYIIEKLGYSICLVHFYKDDRLRHQVMADALRSRVSDPSKVIYIPSVPTIEQLIALFADNEFSISFRLHSWILGLATGRPALGIGANLKYLDIADWAGPEALLFSDIEPLPGVEVVVECLLSDRANSNAVAIKRMAAAERGNHEQALIDFSGLWEAQLCVCHEIEVRVENFYDGVPFRIVGRR